MLLNTGLNKIKRSSMKNLHLLPTYKPSRLGYLTKKGKEVFKDLRFFGTFMPIILDGENQHIYITSDEEIKEGDWVIKISSLYKGGGIIQKYSFIDSQFEDIIFKKIILTTDQDLIADGVQAIDDEFLEWFVKNPSCEKVEVYEVGGKLFSEPIIPQEEPKHISAKPFLDNADEVIVIHRSKQETYDEAAKKLTSHIRQYDWFVQGAKWQAEKMYSEEEVLAFGKKCFYKGFDKSDNDDANCYTAFREEVGGLFEQFKKK